MTARLDRSDAAVVQPGFGKDASSPSSPGADAAHELANLAHELANLMLVVSGSLEQLRRQPLDKQGHGQLARAEWGALQAVQLVRQVLFRAQGGDGEAEVEVVDLNAAVGRFVAIIGQQVEEHVRLTAELAPGRVAVRLDPALLELVLLNLVRNAADAMPDGGTVVIRTCGPRLDGLGDQLATEVSVSDNGTGMPPTVPLPRGGGVLHHQAARQGHGPRLVDGVPFRVHVRWQDQDRDYAGTGHQSLPCPALLQ